MAFRHDALALIGIVLRFFILPALFFYLLILILIPIVTGGLIFQANVRIRSASVLWATSTYFCFQLRMVHSLPNLYPGTFGRLGYVLIPVFLFRVSSWSPAFGAQLYSVTNARIQMMAVSSSVTDVGSKDMVLMLWVPPPRSLKST